MNQIVNVRLPEKLLNLVTPVLEEEGYANVQDLVRSLLREYALEKKREELLKLWGSQSKVKPLSKSEMRKQLKNEFL